MEIIWLEKASDALEDAYDYIKAENPAAAARTYNIIHDKVSLLATMPYMGRQSEIPHVRELIITGTPYIVFYIIHDTLNAVIILHVIHAARDWPNLV